MLGRFIGLISRIGKIPVSMAYITVDIVGVMLSHADLVGFSKEYLLQPVSILDFASLSGRPLSKLAPTISRFAHVQTLE